VNTDCNLEQWDQGIHCAPGHGQRNFKRIKKRAETREKEKGWPRFLASPNREPRKHLFPKAP
jgi:hypothetical protein